ncbi:MAG: hypothetical protein U0Q15_10100 [Kineosporiaceae bacterium]
MTTPRVPPGPPTSTLRVYEPLAAFGPEAKQLAALARRPLSREEADLAEREASWRRVVRGAGGQADDLDVVRFRVVDGAVLACPAQVRLRCAAAAREAVRVLPAPVVAAALGEGGDAATPAQDSGGADQPLPRRPGPPQAPLRPGLRPYVPEGDDLPTGAPAEDLRLRTLVAAWELPWAWLALVEEGERGPGPEPVYLVSMSKARTRAARARKAVREAAGEIDLLHDVEEVGRWLEDFHPRSWVELDLRDVARVLAADRARNGEAVDAEDLGVEDVAMGLASLAEGDPTAVAAAYRRLMGRWQRLQALARAS